MNRKTTKDGITILDADVVPQKHYYMSDEFIIARWIFVGLLALGVLAAVYRIMRMWVLPAKSVKAVVVDKYKYDTPAPCSPTGKDTTYAVIFLVNGKKKRFYVFRPLPMTVIGLAKAVLLNIREEDCSALNKKGNGTRGILPYGVCLSYIRLIHPTKATVLWGPRTASYIASQ